RSRHDHGLGKENRQVRRRARGNLDLRLRGRACGAGPGALLLPSGSTDRPGHRLGHALSACAGMGVFPRAGTAGGCVAQGDGGRMSAEYVIRLPDVGEGIAEAELVEWHVQPGDPVREDTVLAAVMTDKATVEIPSPVAGKVVWLGAE